MKSLTTTRLICALMTGLFFVFGSASAESLKITSSGGDDVVVMEFDNLVIESVKTDAERLGKQIIIRKNINDLVIEDPNTRAEVCVGVNSCNDMIAYCVGTLDSDPACVYNDKGQPVACVC